MVQVSDPYMATLQLQTKVLTNLFFNSVLIPYECFFSLLKSLFAIPILTRISFSEYPDIWILPPVAVFLRPQLSL